MVHPDVFAAGREFPTLQREHLCQDTAGLQPWDLSSNMGLFKFSPGQQPELGKQQKQQAGEKSIATTVRVFSTVLPKDKWEGKRKADTFNTVSSMHMLHVTRSVLLAYGLLCTALSFDLSLKAATPD